MYEGVIAQEQLNIFYPPQVHVPLPWTFGRDRYFLLPRNFRNFRLQHQDIVYVGANVDEPAEVTLVVEAFPRQALSTSKKLLVDLSKKREQFDGISHFVLLSN